MLNPKMKGKMEIPENTYEEQILFHNDQRITISGSEALSYAIQGTSIIGLLYLASNINSSEPPLYLCSSDCR